MAAFFRYVLALRAALQLAHRPMRSAHTTSQPAAMCSPKGLRAYAPGTAAFPKLIANTHEYLISHSVIFLHIKVMKVDFYLCVFYDMIDL